MKIRSNYSLSSTYGKWSQNFRCINIKQNRLFIHTSLENKLLLGYYTNSITTQKNVYEQLKYVRNIVRTQFIIRKKNIKTVKKQQELKYFSNLLQKKRIETSKNKTKKKLQQNKNSKDASRCKLIRTASHVIATLVRVSKQKPTTI